jgi:uncharacterized protein YkwD
MKNVFKKSLLALIILAASALLMTACSAGLDKQEKIDCQKLVKWQKEYKNFAPSDNMIERCAAIGVVIGEVKKPVTKVQPVKVAPIEIKKVATTSAEIKKEVKKVTKTIKKVNKKPFAKQVVNGTEITKSNVYAVVNNKRIEVGLEPLKINTTLEKAAAEKLADLVKYNYWAHTNPVTGSSTVDWIIAKGNFAIGAENLGENFDDINDLLNAWWKSPTHKANIDDINLRETGVAVGNGFIVQEFATKK